jgi:D-glycero-alpha-D-manno-heptose-7-phosphate kinase
VTLNAWSSESKEKIMVITQTPLRISFAGGGTDLKVFYEIEDGKVISTAIDKYIFVIITKRFDDRIYINYSKKEIVDSVKDIQHKLVREAMKKTGMTKGIEVSMLADIPSKGSGLGSSSTLTVGLLNALYQFQGRQVPAELLAEQACEIEIEICKKPIGKQDQYIAAFGGLREFTFKKNGSVEVQNLKLEDKDLRKLSSNIMLFFTNRTRKSDEILTEQREKTVERQKFLRSIKMYVPQVRNALFSKQFDLIGNLLNENWKAKKQLASNITNSEIDEMYELARSAGALGGKITGAGGGGFLLLYVPADRQEMVRNALSEYREFPFMLEQDGSKAIFNLKRQPLN